MTRGPRPESVPDRDVRVPKELAPVEGAPIRPWHEEPTGVHTDAQVFRAVKALGEELKANKAEAARAHGALKQEVNALSKRMDTTDGKLDDMIAIVLPMSGKMDLLVAERRPRSASSDARVAAKEALAEQVLAEQRAETAHRRAVRLKILGAVLGVATSGAVIGALVHAVVS